MNSVSANPSTISTSYSMPVWTVWTVWDLSMMLSDQEGAIRVIGSSERSPAVPCSDSFYTIWQVHFRIITLNLKKHLKKFCKLSRWWLDPLTESNPLKDTCWNQVALRWIFILRSKQLPPIVAPLWDGVQLFSFSIQVQPCHFSKEIVPSSTWWRWKVCG